MSKIYGFLCIALIAVAMLPGCVPKRPRELTSTFESEELDGCMTFLIDMSGSFANSWDDRAYKLFIELSEQYFTEAMGTNNRLIIAQLSGNDRVVVFDGRPSDLQRQFKSPEALNEHLKQNSNAYYSHVFHAIKQTVDYVGALRGVSENTRLLTVVLSDLQDSETDLARRSAMGHAMVDSLKIYRQAGGALALYYVDGSQTARWREVLSMAGFEEGSYVIENELSSTPLLPRFD